MRTIRLDDNVHDYNPIQPKEIVNIVAGGELKGQFIGVDPKARLHLCSLCAMKEYDVRCRLQSGWNICGVCAGLDTLDQILENL